MVMTKEDVRLAPAPRASLRPMAPQRSLGADLLVGLALGLLVLLCLLFATGEEAVVGATDRLAAALGLLYFVQPPFGPA